MGKKSTKQEQQNSLRRAQDGNSLSNDTIVIRSFMAKGIAQEKIVPRVNVYTYNGWQALGRQVNRGEKAGCKVPTFYEDKNGQKKFGKASMFHISQTSEITISKV